jgi:para-nitrobenzyl esterase
MAMDTDQARRIAARLGEIAGVAPRSSELSKLDLDVYRELTAQMMGEVYGSPGAWKVGNQIPVPFCGVTGTEMLPQPVVEGIASKHDSRVKILAGTTKDETSAFLTASFGDLTLDSALGQEMLRSFDADAETVSFYRTMAPEAASDMVILAAIATDIWARRPTRDMVNANTGESFLYEFTWESPMYEPGSGSPQGMDIPFANDDFENMQEVPRGARMLGSNPSEELAGSMHKSFVDFVKTGEPGWPAYTPSDPSTMRFGLDTAVLSTR